jgi:hypothetical protein
MELIDKDFQFCRSGVQQPARVNVAGYSTNLYCSLAPSVLGLFLARIHEQRIIAISVTQVAMLYFDDVVTGSNR